MINTIINSSRWSLQHLQFVYHEQLKKKKIVKQNRKILKNISNPRKQRLTTHAFETKHLFNRKIGTFSHFYVPFCNTSHAALR